MSEGPAAGCWFQPSTPCNSSSAPSGLRRRHSSLSSGSMSQHLIYFEKQEAALCAVHALNNLLQGSFIGEADLASIASELDRQERSLGVPVQEGGSQNVADDGNFSIQVIEAALQIWDLRLSRFFPMAAAGDDTVVGHPPLPAGFICNFESHWLAIRRFGSAESGEWFLLDSCKTSPKPFSQTYLLLYLAQLVNDGYSVFNVTGELPQSQADLAQMSGLSLQQSVANPSRSLQNAAAAGATAAQGSVNCAAPRNLLLTLQFPDGSSFCDIFPSNLTLRQLRDRVASSTGKVPEFALPAGISLFAPLSALQTDPLDEMVTLTCATLRT